MKNKKLLAILLLSLSFCFVSGVGYGEINFPPGAVYEGFDEYYTHPLLEEQPFLGLRKDIELLRLQYCLLEGMVQYIMCNPTNFLYVVEINYDDMGIWQPIYKLPENVDTRGKVCLRICDNRNSFYDKSKVALLDNFKRSLEVIYSFIKTWVTDKNSDVVAIWLSKEGIPLAYFYQGEYHLWEE